MIKDKPLLSTIFQLKGYNDAGFVYAGTQTINLWFKKDDDIGAKIQKKHTKRVIDQIQKDMKHTLKTQTYVYNGPYRFASSNKNRGKR